MSSMVELRTMPAMASSTVSTSMAPAMAASMVAM